MTDFSPLESALYDATPEHIAASLRYLRKADAVMVALMPLSASTQAAPAAAAPAEPVAWVDEFGNAYPLSAYSGKGDWQDDHKRHWRRAYAAPPAAAVPEGYALVPVEPTEAMQDAAERCWEKWRNGNVTEEIWQAMLAAALAERNNTGDNP